MKKMILLLSMIPCKIFCATEEEDKQLAVVGYAKKNNLKDVALAAYPKINKDEMEDAWDLIKQIPGVTANDKPKHKSELTTDAEINAEVCRVLKKHEELIKRAGGGICK